MTIRLRGHHLLCLLGYRGMGYSTDFCVNMTKIYETLRMNPGTEVELVTGPDDICRAYPEDESNHCEGAVYGLDQEVLGQLGFEPGERGSWEAMRSRTAARVKPADISRLCAGCPWESYGVCREGVSLAADGKPMPMINM